MQALRVCSRSVARPLVAGAPLRVRAVATGALSQSASDPNPARATGSVIPLSNVEAQWEKFSAEEQAQVYTQLEEITKKDWKTLSIDEKKAAYYVAFGPHGPRAPVTPPGTTPKILLGVTAIIAASAALFFAVRSTAPPPPKTMTKEWQEAANERAKEMNINPIHGIASEGYKGQGFVTEK